MEKNTSRLADVEEDFFDTLEEFAAQQKEAYLKSLKNFSSAKTRDFINLKKMIEEIFSMREKKLLNKALVSSRTGDVIEEKMATQEKKTFKELLGVLNKHKSFLEEIFSAEEGNGKTAANLDKVEILESVPSFVGADMKEYGPFEKEEIVELPEKIALLLLSRKLAQKSH